MQESYERLLRGNKKWVYGFNNGLITDLNVMMDEISNLELISRYDLLEKILKVT